MKRFIPWFGFETMLSIIGAMVLFSLGAWEICAQETTPPAVTPAATPAATPAVTPAEASSPTEAPASSSEPTAPAEEFSISNAQTDAVETLEVSEEHITEADEMATAFTEQFCQNVTTASLTEYAQIEAERIRDLCEGGGNLRRLLAGMTTLNDVEFPEFQPLQKPIAEVLLKGITPVAQEAQASAERLRWKVSVEQRAMEDLHFEVIQRRFLIFEIESNRHILLQIASMLSLDKRWFWLYGVLAFGMLVIASFHERRHEIRRWLNGGIPRQMGLSKVLSFCFIGLVGMTLVSFLFGERIYEAMLNMTFQADSPYRMHEEAIKAFTDALPELKERETEAKTALAAQQKEWNALAKKNLPNSTEILAAWNQWRTNVRDISVQLALQDAIAEQIEQDRNTLRNLNSHLLDVSGETLQYLRWKHLLRFVLGAFLSIATFLGIASYWAERNRRKKQIFRTCPHCLAENTLRRDGAAVVCEHVLSETPHEECGYRFERKYRPLIKLSFPTLGIPQVGKTHWLTMLYWEMQQKHYPQVPFQPIPSSVTVEMDRRIDEIMKTRLGTSATQRDRIPLPLVMAYRDKDRFGRTPLLVDIFDYSGEITTDATADDYRRERALKSEGFFFFLDPTFPWQPQAEALKRFRKDLRSVKGLDKNESLRLPIAICLTKIDLLPLASALQNPEEEAVRFYDELAAIDPTGVAIHRRALEQRSVATDALRKKIWPDWDVEKQILDLFGGRHMFFPLTPVGLDGVGETDLRLRTIDPFGLVAPLAWLLEMSGYPTLESS